MTAIIYEYAGFRYEITDHPKHGLAAIPLAGQHRAAWKAKHRQAALDQYKSEGGRAPRSDREIV